MYMQAVRKDYSQKNAEAGPEQSIDFRNSSISLDIPKDVINNHWRIIPIISTTVNYSVPGDTLYNTAAVCR